MHWHDARPGPSGMLSRCARRGECGMGRLPIYFVDIAVEVGGEDAETVECHLRAEVPKVTGVVREAENRSRLLVGHRPQVGGSPVVQESAVLRCVNVRIPRLAQKG